MMGPPAGWPRWPGGLNVESRPEVGEGVGPGYRLVEGALKPALGTWFDWTIEGAANIPTSGPAILASNHVSYLDPLALANVVLRAGRQPRFLAKSELFADRRIAWALRLTRQIEVKRGTSQVSVALEEAFRALELGDIVVIFPEGTVTTNPDLRPMAPKSGAARLALGSRAPLLPCATWGTANVWPKGDYRKRLRPGQDILVRIGEPRVLDLPDTPEGWRAANERIMGEIARLVAGLRPVVADTRRPVKRPA